MFKTITKEQLKPIVITRNPKTGREIASFELATGLNYVQLEGLRRAKEVGSLDVGEFTTCLGVVLVQVTKKDFKDIIRRESK